METLSDQRGSNSQKKGERGDDGSITVYDPEGNVLAVVSDDGATMESNSLQLHSAESEAPPSQPGQLLFWKCETFVSIPAGKRLDRLAWTPAPVACPPKPVGRRR